MSIVFLNPPIEYYSPVSGGAISTIIAEVARVLEARGVEVTVLSRVDDGPIFPSGKVVPLGPCGWEDLHLLQRRLSWWRGRSQAWDWPFFDYYQRAVTAAVQALPVPPATLILFNDLISAPFLRKLLPFAEIFVWLQNEQNTWQSDLTASRQATTGWLACSDYIREWNIQRHGLAPERVHTVPSGVNLTQFHPRADFTTAPGEVRVLFVGRLDKNKGPDLALDAVASLRAESLPVTMTVAGGKWFYHQAGERADPFVTLVQEKIAFAGARGLGHVPFLGIGEVYREHDVVCVLSRSQEPFGLVVLEAMASGCAVLASDRGGLVQACGGAASLVDPSQPAAILDALRRLVAEPAFLARQKQAGLARAQCATWETTVDTLMPILHLEKAAA